MTTPVSELKNIRIEPPKPFKFQPKLLEGRDAQGNLGLNAVLTYQYLEGNAWVKRDIRIEVEPGLETNGHIPYAYQFIPPLERKLSNPRVPSTRTFPIIRIVAAPGVNIYLPKLNDKRPDLQDPLVKIFRVQEIGQVPPLGRDIREYDYVHTSWIDPDPTSKLVVLPQHHVRIETGRNGVDIVQDMFQTRYVVRVKSAGTNSGIDRFLYKFVKRSGQIVLVVMATEQVMVEIHETGIVPLQLPKHFFGYRQNNPLDEKKLQIQYLPVPNLYAFNLLAPLFYLDDFPRVPQGHVVESSKLPPIRHVSTADDLIGLALIDASIGFAPVVGDLYDLAQFVYGVTTGTNLHGIKVSEGELVVMGLCVLLPFVSIGMIKGMGKGAQALQELGPKADVAAELADGIKLDAEQWQLLDEASNLVAQGKKLPDKLIGEIMDSIDLPPHQLLAMDDLLDASKGHFNQPQRLRELYQEYVARQTKKGEKVAPPDQWARNQRHGEANDILLFLLGKEFRTKTSAPSLGKFSTINAADVIRPTSLDDARLSQFIREILDQPEFELLLHKIPAEKIMHGKIDKELFGTIKGNVGEIMAKEYKDKLIAARKTLYGDDAVELYDNVTIVIRKNQDGNFTDKFWEFTDGIIGGLNKDGDFVIKDIIEVKAGDAVANKVQKQIFDWVEDNITDGARIRLPDDREFDYFPTDPNAKRVIGLANAKRHVINPQGKSHLGMQSSQQIAAKLERTELPFSAEEIEFITALIQNTQEVPLNTTNAELDYLVTELAQRISAAGAVSP